MDLEFEKAAMRNDPMPQGLRLSEQKAYTSLRNLYAQYFLNLISLETAKAEKQEIKRALATERSKEEFLDRENKVLAKRIKEASERYKEKQTIENANRLYAAFYNLAEDSTTARD